MLKRVASVFLILFPDSPTDLEFIALPSKTLFLDLSNDASRKLPISFTVIAPELAPVNVSATFLYKDWPTPNPTSAPPGAAAPGPAFQEDRSLQDFVLDLTPAFSRSAQYFFGLDESVQIAESSTPLQPTAPLNASAAASEPRAHEADEVNFMRRKWSKYFRTAFHVASYSAPAGDLFKRFGDRVPNGTLVLSAKLDERFLKEKEASPSSYREMSKQLEIKTGTLFYRCIALAASHCIRIV